MCTDYTIVFPEQRTKRTNSTTRNELLKVALIAVLLCTDTADAEQDLHIICIRLCNVAYKRCISKECPTSVSTEQYKKHMESCKLKCHGCYTDCNAFLS
ncbi:hypothetical protein LSAT2_007542 [Lamellibrachia satsuma]|nr:hypothetical protein LSAT2_007542 [Lamellibrachia satsuma]